MSQELLSHNSDLKRLRDEGYEVEIISSYLVIRNIPHVNPSGEIRYGSLVSTLQMSGDKTSLPTDHTAFWIGEPPCKEDGNLFSEIINSQRENLNIGGLVAKIKFSRKPTSGFKDYFHKMNFYESIISNFAKKINPQLTSKKFKPIDTGSINDCPFQFLDTSSSRAGISNLSKKLSLKRIDIIGLGGTGSYVLDQISKIPVKEIFLHDDDKFYSHNAFRAPGAPSVKELNRSPYKVSYFKSKYSKIHKGIVANKNKIGEENISELKNSDFVFLCMDGNSCKRQIILKLIDWKKPFIDVGMGLQISGTSISGMIRTTLVSEKQNSHSKEKIKVSETDKDDLYEANIQVADLNALNAILAIIKFKKFFGFYADIENEHNSRFLLESNQIMNEVRINE